MTARRIALLLVAGVALALCAAAPVAEARPSLHVAFGESRFPSRSLIVTAPVEAHLNPSSLHIAENGAPVKGVSVAPITHASLGDFGVVLAIDTSSSMRGAPLAAAMAAARSFAAQRTPNQELGIVTFDETPSVALPLTNDQAAIDRALAHTPPVGHGAHIYDALAQALHQLQAADIADGAVILLSDGDSHGAKPHPGAQVTLHSIATTATEAHARIFTVGLRDSSYTPQRMSLLARVGGGEFVEASSAQLTEVFAHIDSALASQYLVRYRSAQPLGNRITVTVYADGVPGSWSARYSSPAPPPATGAHRVPKSGHGVPFWTSTLALVLVSFGSAILLTLGLVIVPIQRILRRDVRSRVRQFTQEPASVATEVPAEDRSPGWAHRLFQGAAWWPGFKENLEIARIEWSPEQVIAVAAITTFSAGVIISVLAGTPALAIPAFLLGPVVTQAVINRRLAEQRKLFGQQLPANLQEMAAAMRAGHSLVGGLRSMVESATEPTKGEFANVLADEQLGVPLDAALLPVAKRMDCDAVRQVALVASLHQQTGGNMAAVLDQVADSLRERLELERELESLTAQARLTRWILTLLPAILMLVITVINPNYMRPLFVTPIGIALLCLAIVLVVIGSLTMRKIADVRV